ncbi:hypothetical protein GCM10009682_08050 [Luedemannella flava]|uniref:Uncharacterized protein n=1 Tax=Luedemannella flava TaxID=349316 RepID=A0ABP4XQY8_9ACTN
MFAELVGLRSVHNSTTYLYLTSLLLGVGLFSSTVGIDLAEAKDNKRIIIAAVTVGVFAKAAMIGGILYLATRDPVYLVLGVAVAQIDPLSVAAIMGDSRMSSRVKSILGAWASFDDPMTVILVVYVSAVATQTFGLGEASGQGPVTDGLLAYGIDLALNLALAGLAYLAWLTLRARPWILTIVLSVLAVIAVAQFLMLAIAIAGLFMRTPLLERLVGRIVNYALLFSSVLLGLLLVNGVNLTDGLLLGVMAFVAQIVAGMALTRKFSRTDRLHLALAQQNGITAIILSLRLETQFSGSVAVIAPAILVTNVIHYVANWLTDRRWGEPARGEGRETPEPSDPGDAAPKVASE